MLQSKIKRAFQYLRSFNECSQRFVGVLKGFLYRIALGDEFGQKGAGNNVSIFGLGFQNMRKSVYLFVDHGYLAGTYAGDFLPTFLLAFKMVMPTISSFS
jgi:hypothetical protein